MVLMYLKITTATPTTIINNDNTQYITHIKLRPTHNDDDTRDKQIKAWGIQTLRYNTNTYKAFKGTQFQCTKKKGVNVSHYDKSKR